ARREPARLDRGRLDQGRQRVQPVGAEAGVSDRVTVPVQGDHRRRGGRRSAARAPGLQPAPRGLAPRPPGGRGARACGARGGGGGASAPFVAALMAASGHGGETSGAFFAQNVKKLNDVTTGTNGTCATQGNILCTAGTGWDGPTGYGTPIVSQFAPGAGSGSG